MARQCNKSLFFKWRKKCKCKKTNREEANAWFEFHDEKSLEKVLLIILDIIEELGLKWFKENEPKITFSPFLVEILDGKYQEEINIFFRQNFLKVHDPNCLSKIEQILEQNPTLENISLANRFFGEYIIHQLGAEWDFRPNNEIYLNHIGGIKNFNKGTFRIIDNYISDPTMHSINKSYLNIKNTVENIKSS